MTVAVNYHFQDNESEFQSGLSCIISMHRGCNLHSRIYNCCFSHLWTRGNLCIVKPVSSKRFGLSDDFSRLSFLDFSFYSHFSRKVFEIRKGACKFLIFFSFFFFAMSCKTCRATDDESIPSFFSSNAISPLLLKIGKKFLEKQFVDTFSRIC